jgi:protein phosphatase
MIQIESICLTHPGHKRPHNEDFVLAWVPDDLAEFARSGSLYVVADGVGGAGAGEVASRYAAEAVLHGYFAGDEEDRTTRLEQVVSEVSRTIYDYNEAHPELRPMGTTLVAALICGDELTVANVGDSRAYLLRANHLQQITADHNVVARMVAQGEISAEDAASHPWRNRLTRCLGVDPEVSVDTFQHTLQLQDTIILCSDGLTRHVQDDEIVQIATQYRPSDAVRRLVDLANQRGGLDNISVVLLRILSGKDREKKPGIGSLPNPDLDTTYRTAIRKRRWRWPFRK